jgi:hypothetical protein
MANFIPFSGVSSIFKAPTKTGPPLLQRHYTPKNWTDGSQAQLYMLRIPLGQEVLPIGPNASENADENGSSFGFEVRVKEQILIFDALRRATHRLTATPTQHPLQFGFNIADHVIMQPVTLTLEVAMSDAIASRDSYGDSSIPMWTGNPSKSVSAFQQMKSLMEQRVLLTLNTRLETYKNVVLIAVDVEETARTYFGGLSMVLSFQQLFIANVTVQTASQRPQSTAQTTEGQKGTTPPTQAVTDQHKVEKPSTPVNLKDIVVAAPGAGPSVLQEILHVIGAGDWSSSIFNLKTIGL